MCVLDELRQRRERPKTAKLSRYTQILMQMEVGAQVEFEPMQQSRLTTLRTTARKHMGVPDAKWRGEVQANGLILVTRLPNGAEAVPGKPPHPAAGEMAKMAVGEEKVIAMPKTGFYHMKPRARKMLDIAEANWRSTALANGKFRVKRVA